MDGKYKNLPWALAKELSQTKGRPSWESRNEGIHERISFDDTIWGFNLAGGAYYDTPLRVTRVKENSRADKAGIKVGDVLRFINDVDTSLLTVQEAHDIILQSGIEIKLKLSAPDVEEPYHYTYEDEILKELREMKRKREQESKQKRKPFTGAKTNSEWSCAWPCNKKRDVTYRESNCFQIPSKHEEKMRLKREKERLDEDRAAEQIYKRKIIAMMKTQNAYNMMDSDEEIEPQYFELLHKNRENENHRVDDISKEQETKCTIKHTETSYIPDVSSDSKRDEHQELSHQNAADVVEKYTEEDKLPEKEDSISGINEQFINNNNIIQAEYNMKIQDIDFKGITDENSFINISGDGINNLTFINGNLSKEGFENLESESGNENQDDTKKIDLQNENKLCGENETQLLDTEFSIPNNDDDIFCEELVILDENETNSLTEENNQEIDIQNVNKLSEENETQLLDRKFSIPNNDDDIFYEELVILDESEKNSLTEENNQEIDIQNENKLSEEKETQLLNREFSIPNNEDDIFFEELVILDETETNS